jgi:drug/metabolite transporter (DMT)-like permease
MSPALHAALTDNGNAPPVLLLNAVVSVVALFGLVLGGPLLEASTPLPRSLVENTEKEAKSNNDDGQFLPLEAQAGLELGLWKMLGTTANLYGLSLTTADHGAFLIQLTTLIVPTVQGIMGVPIPDRIKTAIALALGGVFLFTSDPTAGGVGAAAATDAANSMALGDAMCVVAAGFYATYDLRLFKWGKLVKARELITGKILTQAVLSTLLLLGLGYGEAADFVANATWDNSGNIVLLALWAGLAVNAVAPFLQVGGQQAVGPTRAQTLYASQPLWAAIISFVFLGETVGQQGLIGGAAFLSALFLAATAEPPDPDCGVENCEV